MAIPWLTTPAEQFGAMERGAALGLQRRAQGQEEFEAAQKLNLAYNQLAQQAFESERANQTQAQRAAAADALRKQQQENLMQWHKDQVEQHRDAAAALAKYREDTLDARDKASTGKAPTVHESPEGLLQWNPVTQQWDMVSPKTKPDKEKPLSHAERIEEWHLKREIEGMDKAIAAETDEEKKKALQSNRSDLIQRLKKLGTGEADFLNLPPSDAPTVPFDLFGTMGKTPAEMSPGTQAPAAPALNFNSAPSSNAPARLRYNPDTGDFE